jgi:hypothetical protein
MNTKNTASQPKGTPQESIGDDANYLTIVLDVSSPEALAYGKKLLQGSWTASSWSHAIWDRNAALARVEYLDSKLRAPADQAASVAVPEGYVVMPARLTAANGAKGLLSGEFSERVRVPCPDCRDEADDFECQTCENFGAIEQAVAITWDTIKSFYEMAVEHLAAPAAQQSLSPAAEVSALRKLCDQLDGMKRRMRHTPGSGQNDSYLFHDDVAAYVQEARKSLAAEGQVSAAAPADLSDEEIILLANRTQGRWDSFGGPKNSMLHFARAIESKIRASEGQAQTSEAAVGEYLTCCDHPDCSKCAGRGGIYRVAAQSADKPTGGGQ